MSTKPIIMVMVGLPGSGKSTYVSKFLQPFDVSSSPVPNMVQADCVVLSTDSLIEEYAKSIGKTYNEVFSDAYKDCEKSMKEQFRNALETKRNIIYDQTNVSLKKRVGILSQVPSYYHKIVVYFDTALDTIKERLVEREKHTGKRIAWSIVEDMHSRLEVPTLEEGFDEIMLI